MCTGRTADALVDFTGGVAEKLMLTKFNLSDPEVRMPLFMKMRDACDSRALINCNIEVI